ncbi:Zn-dependent hydrolase [Nocardioides phosphati]|uniref:Zn-dependent hydrolase n=1 Tax=Nocardioides phosphati TaxID=1867775 RepID=A0ABQ2NB76_9ACTN|nr:MBL fold metallo-hydrolase [Nocardioides phosphati]GGO88628.1 Zn-dependent hydrolase [Nocardioides phosphati]
MSAAAPAVRVDRVVTSGTFSLDGGTWDVDNNVWVVGDDRECVVIDAAHDAGPILEAVAGRTVKAILLTHAHDDHITAVGDLRAATGAPAYLHPADRVLWDKVYDEAPDRELADGDTFEVGGVTLQTLHTPGHAPGACCFHVPELGVVFTGDTLFHGGPGATGRSFSDFPTIIGSISTRLLGLPPETVVHTGHGDDTSIGAERGDIDAWIARGH